MIKDWEHLLIGLGFIMIGSLIIYKFVIKKL